MGILAQLIFGIVGGIFAGRAFGKSLPDADKYLRLAWSLAISSFVSFGVVFSASGLAALAAGRGPWEAVAIGLFSGVGASAAAVLNLSKRSPLLKGISVFVPREAEESAMTQAGTYTERELQSPK